MLVMLALVLPHTEVQPTSESWHMHVFSLALFTYFEYCFP